MITTNVNGNPISQGFIDEIRSDSPNTIARLWYNGAEVPCDIVEITVEKGSCGSDPFMIGEVIGDLLQATVKDLDANLKGEIIECHIGALVNGDYEYISLGRFKVSEIKKTRYQSKITAYSGIVADSGNDFNNSGLNEPTIAELAIRLQSDLNCTISFDNGIDTTLPITAQLTEITDYQALQILAICCGGYAINTIDGNIVVKKYDATPTLEVDTGMMVNLPEIAEAEYKVRQIGVLVSDATVDNEGEEVEAVYYALDTQGYIKVAKQGTEYYLIDAQGNRIIADIRPETADIYFECAYMTEAMFNANIVPVVGYAYYPATIDLTLGDPRLEGCDVLQVEEVDGSLYAVPCHKVTHKYSGGFTTEVKSAEASDEENSIGTEYPITQRLQSLDRKTGTAQATADNAYQIADNTNQYFWFTGTGTDTGAHITEVPQEQWNDPNSLYYHTGGNLLARSNGIAVRQGLTELATFGASGAQVGMSISGHTIIEASGMKVYGSNGSVQLANIGYDVGAGQGGSNTAPFYTLGHRQATALDYSSSRPYKRGQLCMYDSKLYICKVDITAEAWDSSHWTDLVIGNYSFAEGYDTTASAYASHAEGLNSVACLIASHAEGWGTRASAETAHAEGFDSVASGDSSHAEGYMTEASGDYTHAEGFGSVAIGLGSHAEGNQAQAGGEYANYAHAEGNYTVASANFAHAQNSNTIADQECQTAIGKYNTPNNTDNLFAIGWGTSGNPLDVFEVDRSGNVDCTGKLISATQGTMVGSGNISSSGNNHTYSINANATKNQSFTIQRAGYYPLCIDRINLGGTGSDKICLNKYGITARANGSVTYEVAYYNPTSTNYDSITVAVYVLWVKL